MAKYKVRDIRNMLEEEVVKSLESYKLNQKSNKTSSDEYHSDFKSKMEKYSKFDDDEDFKPPKRSVGKNFDTDAPDEIDIRNAEGGQRDNADLEYDLPPSKQFKERAAKDLGKEKVAITKLRKDMRAKAYDDVAYRGTDFEFIPPGNNNKNRVRQRNIAAESEIKVNVDRIPDDISIIKNYIPENLKKDGNIIEISDGNRLCKVRWDGDVNGQTSFLLYKDSDMINEEVAKMKKLFMYEHKEYMEPRHSRSSEEKMFFNILNKAKDIDKEKLLNL